MILAKLLCTTAVLVCLSCSDLRARDIETGPGLSATEITIGQTMPYSGPASAYAAIGRAEAAYFRMINERGGIGGRKVTLLSLDDGYTPNRTVEQVRRLVEQDHVQLIFSTFGTATNAAIQRYLNDRGVPQLFPVSGSARWADPDRFPWTMGFQPTLRAEGRAIARYILQAQPNALIAVLYQNDDFGKDYVKGLEQGLGTQAKRRLAMRASYETTDPTVESQIIALRASGADILIDVSTSKFTAQAIRKMADLDWRPLHFVFSGSSSRAEVLAPAGLDNARGLMTSQWAKDPTDPKWQNDAATQEWLQWLARYYPQGERDSALNVAGYNWAMVLDRLLRQCGSDFSRVNIMRQAANLDFQLPMMLPGIRVSTSPHRFNAVHDLALKRFNGEFWESVGDIILGE
jgi:ABC-type branched-subunit amino acid transport system substrate-binding protein